MSSPTPNKNQSQRLNHAFLKYFSIGKDEEKSWKSKETVSLGGAILAHYGIGFLDGLAFELEQFVGSALFFPKQKKNQITGKWIAQLFSGEILGHSLPDAFLGVCYEERIRTQRDFIQAFDYLGICWKLIDYFSVHREQRDRDAKDLEKIEKKQFEKWIALLKIPQVGQDTFDSIGIDTEFTIRKGIEKKDARRSVKTIIQEATYLIIRDAREKGSYPKNCRSVLEHDFIEDLFGVLEKYQGEDQLDFKLADNERTRERWITEALEKYKKCTE